MCGVIYSGKIQNIVGMYEIKIFGSEICKIFFDINLE